MLKQGLNNNGEYIRDMYVDHEPVDLVCGDDGMTRQEFADECDINVLMERYERTGVLTHYSAKSPKYLDLSEMPTDLMGTLRMMDEADAAFMTLPAVVRREFDNDALKFVEFAGDRRNLSKLREWGLAAPEAPADASNAPDLAPVAPTPSTEP